MEIYSPEADGGRRRDEKGRRGRERTQGCAPPGTATLEAWPASRPSRGLWTSVSLKHEPGQYAPGAPRPCAGAHASTAGACGCEAAESHLEHSSRGPSGSRKVRVQAEVDGRARLFFRTWQQVSDGQPRVPRPVRCKISFGGDTKRCKNCSSYPEENLRSAY